MKFVIKLLRGLIVAVLSIIIIGNLWLLVQQAVFKKDPPELFGYSQFIVTSGSMEPTLSAGDLVMVKGKSSYQLGDVATYRDLGGALVTHRLVGKTGEGFITKGDANNVEDEELLTEDRIIGGMVTVIPGIGNIMLFLKSPLGILVLLIVGVLLVELPSWAGALKEKARGKHAHGVENS